MHIELLQDDITNQNVDIIVNAANSSLMGGGGVDGAIHRAGGPEILAACRVLRENQGPCPPGKAVITTAGKLRARHVVHTVGPVWNGGDRGEPELLANCYRSSLDLCIAHGCTSIAFPNISTGFMAIRNLRLRASLWVRSERLKDGVALTVCSLSVSTRRIMGSIRRCFSEVDSCLLQINTSGIL